MQDDKLISPLKAFFKKKWVVFVLIIDIVAILALIVIAIIQSLRSSTITFNVAPIDATISVNGDSNYTNNSYLFMPGQYEIIVSHPDLEEKKITAQLEPNHSLNFDIFLSNDNDFEFYTLKDNYRSFLKLAEIVSNSKNESSNINEPAIAFVEEYEKAYSVFSESLPINIYEYKEELTETGSIEYTTTIDVTITKNNSDACRKTICLKAKIQILNDKSIITKTLEEKGLKTNFYEIENEELF